MDKFKIIPKNKINELPKTSGVYCFTERESRTRSALIYIGKAINIKNRVKNHFNQPSYRDDLFMNKVDRIGYFETGSEIEALVLEANLIKKYQPRFNVVWRDDKNYFYVAISLNDQKIPYVFITHQKNYSKTEYIGPFVEGNALKKTLRYLKRVFPYYTSKKHSKNKCTWCHLGLCPGPTPNLPEYRKNIRKLILILQGRRNAVLNSLKRKMKQLSKQSRFEEAGKIRDRIYNLEQVMSHTNVINAEINLTHKVDDRYFYEQEILKKIVGTSRSISKIECYDVSNIQGKFATGSMIVFENGIPNKNLYRKFKIRIKNEPNDIAMLKEVLTRRLAHKEWQYPEVILIDGGKAQLNAGISVIPAKAGIQTISIAKGRQELFIEGRAEPIPLKSLPQEIYNLIKNLDDEAHRFAITYHKKLRKKSLLQ